MPNIKNKSTKSMRRTSKVVWSRQSKFIEKSKTTKYSSTCPYSLSNIRTSVGEDMKFVKAKYFQLAKLYHPDKHLNSPDILKKQVEEYFKRISIAYNSLTQISAGQWYVKHKTYSRRTKYFPFFLLYKV